MCSFPPSLPHILSTSPADDLFGITAVGTLYSLQNFSPKIIGLSSIQPHTHTHTHTLSLSLSLSLSSLSFLDFHHFPFPSFSLLKPEPAVAAAAAAAAGAAASGASAVMAGGDHANKRTRLTDDEDD